MKNIQVLQGANLNVLGLREKDIYGQFTLMELHDWLSDRFSGRAELTFFQTNQESEMIERIHSLKATNTNGIIINAGAWTHTSIAIRDALLAMSIPFIEVHISNIYKRETFRHLSYLGDVALGQVSGLGKFSYSAAIEYFLENM